MASITQLSLSATPGKKYTFVAIVIVVADGHTVSSGAASRIVYSQVSSKSTGDEIVYRGATSNTAYSKARSKKVVDSERTVSA